MVKRSRLNKKKRKNIDRKDFLVISVIVFVILLVLFNLERFTGLVTDSAPTAPSNLTAEVLTNNFVSLKWKDNSNNEEGFKMERKEGDNGQWEVFTTTQKNIWSGSGAFAPKINTLYYYRIKAYNPAGESAYSNEVSAIITVTIPTAPSNLKAEAISSSKAKLSWSDNSDNEGGFLIEYKKSGEWSALVNNLNENSKQHMIISLTPGATYSFRVAAINAGGTSGYTEATTTMPSGSEAVGAEPFAMTDINMDRKINVVDAMYIAQYVAGKRDLTSVQMLAADVNCDGIVTTEDANKIAEYRVGKLVELPLCTSIITNTGGVPLAPSRVRAVADPVKPQITITWQDNSNNEQGFRIKRVLGGTNQWVEITQVPAGTTTYTDKETAENTGYSYRVESYNSIGESIQGSTTYAKTGSAVLSTPTNLQATASLGDANFDGSVNGADSFVITEYVEGLRNLTQKQLAVSNVNADGNVTREDSYAILAYSVGIIKVLPTTPPTAPYVPSKFKAVADKASPSIKLTWQDNSDNEQGFKIGRVFAGTNKWTGVVDLPANTITYTDTGLEPNTTHTYTIKSYNQQGESIQGGSSQATTPIVVSTPTNLQATPSQTEIRLSWSDSKYEDGYKIERKKEGGSWEQIKILPADTITYTDLGLDIGATYTYRVRAYNTLGSSEPSNEFRTTTLEQKIEAPTELKIDSKRVHPGIAYWFYINLSWKDNSNNEEQFLVEQKQYDGTWSTVSSFSMNTEKSGEIWITSEGYYSYRIRAYNSSIKENKYSEPSNELTFYFYDGKITIYNNTLAQPTGPPTKPTNFKIAEQEIPYDKVWGMANITLSWTDANNEEGYIIQRKSNLDSLQQEIIPANTQKSIKKYQISNGYYYTYSIRSFNYYNDILTYSEPEELEFSYYNGEITIRDKNLTQAIEPPTKPINIKVTEQAPAVAWGVLLINLSWTDMDNDEEGYVIEEKNKIWDDWETEQILPANAQRTVQSIRIVNSYGLHYIRIRSFNFYNKTITYSEPSSELQLSLGHEGQYPNDKWILSISEKQAQSASPPETPTNFQVTEKKAKGTKWMTVKFSWTDTSNEEGYVIENMIKPERGWESAMEEFPQNTQKTLEGIDVYTGYGNGYPYLRIKSFNSYNGTKTYSEPSAQIDLSGGVLAPQPPTFPTMYNCKISGIIVDGYPSDTVAIINWYDNSNDEDGFKVERAIDNGEWVEIASLPAGSTSYSASIMKGMPNVGQSISVRVKSYNKNGESISNKCTSTRNS